MKSVIFQLLIGTISFCVGSGFASIARTCSSFVVGFRHVNPSNCQPHLGDATRSMLKMSDAPSQPTPDEDEYSPEQGDEPSLPPPPPAMVSQPTSGLQPIPQTQKKLDPLLRSLTRSDDPNSANAPTMSVPLLGELVLDKSLFVLLPVAGFAVIGFFLSIYVALNSSDAFVVLEEAATQGKKDPIEVVDGCRGICSTQEQDLEGLRQFMNSLSK
mmetsp:Transcript_25691/g.53513  ORF Transcript_25691/g.53513 Transcript_25691/m.53513 type:complete len:214 (-) Transcript_25691:2359-3000(-)